MNLKGKTALITGGAVRVGRAMTLALAEDGANVVINYNRSAGRGGSDCRRSPRVGRRSPGRAGRRRRSRRRGSARASRKRPLRRHRRARQQRVALHPARGLHETTLEQWHFVLGALLDGPFLLCQAFAPGMIERGEGLIVNIVDRAAFAPFPRFLAHSVGKHGLLGLTRNLAVELAPAVRVNAISPGPVLPPVGYTPEQNARIAENTLLQRWGSPDDVVKALRYLVDADYVTGEVLFVDGGERWK